MAPSSSYPSPACAVSQCGAIPARQFTVTEIQRLDICSCAREHLRRGRSRPFRQGTATTSAVHTRLPRWTARRLSQRYYGPRVAVVQRRHRAAGRLGGAQDLGQVERECSLKDRATAFKGAPRQARPGERDVNATAQWDGRQTRAREGQSVPSSPVLPPTIASTQLRHAFSLCHQTSPRFAQS